MAPGQEWGRGEQGGKASFRGTTLSAERQLRNAAPCQRELHGALVYRVLLKPRVQSCAGVEDYIDQSFCHFVPWLSRPTPKHENHLCGSHCIYQTSPKLVAILLPHLCAMCRRPQLRASVSWCTLLGLCSVVFVESFLASGKKAIKNRARWVAL